MDNGIILYLTFIIPLAIIVLFYFLLNKRKKRDAIVIKSDWASFERALNNKQITQINELGTKLIWNEHLTMKKLEKMAKEINTLEKDHQILTELKLLIYNKYLSWGKKHPYTI